jgi:hypothetical protein
MTFDLIEAAQWSCSAQMHHSNVNRGWGVERVGAGVGDIAHEHMHITNTYMHC